MLRLSGQVPGGSFTAMDGHIGAGEQICGVNFSIIINNLIFK